MKTNDLVKASLFAVLIALCSQITVPIPLIPITLQVFAIALSALVLPRKQAMFAVLIYILMGLLGLPVFAGGRGGLGVIVSPTFGFILGFIPMTYFISSIKKPSLGLSIGYLALYCIAIPFLTFYLRSSGVTTSITQIVQLYWFKFMPTDFISLALSFFVSQRVLKVLPMKQSVSL